MKTNRTLALFLALTLCLSLLSGLAVAENAAAAKPAPQKVVITGSHDVAKGLKIRLTASVSPDGAPQDLIWKSADPDIAKVSRKGVVTGLKEGTTVITAASGADAKVRRKWEIKVWSKPVEKVLVVAPSDQIVLSDVRTLQLKTAVEPKWECASALVWKSSDPKIAKVSDTGLVTAKKPGRVTVTATAADGSKVSGSITLTVVRSTEEPAENRNYYALLICNEKYQHINQLPSTPRDVNAFRNTLKGLSQPWKITVRKNLTAKQIRSAIYDAFKGATENDVCLFFYAGHGHEDTDVDCGALIGVSHNPESEQEDHLKASQVAYALDKACPGKVIAIFECCGSGSYLYQGESLSWERDPYAASGNPKAFNRSVLSAFTSVDGPVTSNTGELLGSKFSVITACEHGDWELEVPLSQKIDGGILTYCLVNAMGCDFPNGAYSGKMPADTNGDSRLTLPELMAGARKIYNEDLRKRFKDLTPEMQYHGDPAMILFTRE